MKRIIALVMLASILSLCGCECMSGFGRDVQHMGQWIERTSEDIRN